MAAHALSLTQRLEHLRIRSESNAAEKEQIELEYQNLIADLQTMLKEVNSQGQTMDRMLRANLMGMISALEEGQRTFRYVMDPNTGDDKMIPFNSDYI